jgi:arabinogalactan oligomer/maltooligosaccharide transport system substrate-binding protein
MYYDKSVFSGVDMNSMEAIIAKCEETKTLFSFDIGGNGWYIASFFFATGCQSNWTMDESGKFTSVDDTYNSEAGLVALKGMQKLLHSSAWNGSANGGDFANKSSVVVSGTWDAPVVQEILGENFAATKLPSFTVDGKTYQLGSFSGNKLMGVKPQEDAERLATFHKVAQYLTGEECQTERFAKHGWGPSNKVAQSSEAVKNDIALSALAAQSAFATPQGNIHGSWWDISKVLPTAAQEAKLNDVAALQAGLNTYTEQINALFSMTEDQLNAWSLIGSINGTSWDTDIAMTEVSDGVWESAPLTLNAGEEFKARKGASWDVNMGVGGAWDGANVVVETTGTYVVKVTVTMTATNVKGDVIGSIELIAQ